MEAAVRVAGGNGFEGRLEPGVGVDAVQFRRLDRRGEARTHRAGAAPPSESLSAIRRAADERHGQRAEESAARARKLPWKRSDRNSKAGRSWFDWLPIFGLTETQVFDVIRAAGQSPHPAYGMGMSTLSCVFCIMASRADLRTAARLQPALYRRYVRLEERIGHTLSPTGVPLPVLTGVPVEHDPGARRFERSAFPLAGP